MEKHLAKELGKHGMIGMIMFYFLWQDAEDRKISRIESTKRVVTLERINDTMIKRGERIIALEKGVEFLHYKIKKIER